MKFAFCALGAALLLAACASQPAATDETTAATSCGRDSEPPIGSNLRRRIACAEPATKKQ